MNISEKTSENMNRGTVWNKENMDMHSIDKEQHEDRQISALLKEGIQKGEHFYRQTEREGFRAA